MISKSISEDVLAFMFVFGVLIGVVGSVMLFEGSLFKAIVAYIVWSFMLTFFFVTALYKTERS